MEHWRFRKYQTLFDLSIGVKQGERLSPLLPMLFVNDVYSELSVGARCSSVVRVLAHGAMGRRIDPSWWTH